MDDAAIPAILRPAQPPGRRMAGCGGYSNHDADFDAAKMSGWPSA